METNRPPCCRMTLKGWIAILLRLTFARRYRTETLDAQLLHEPLGSATAASSRLPRTDAISDDTSKRKNCQITNYVWHVASVSRVLDESLSSTRRW